MCFLCCVFYKMIIFCDLSFILAFLNYNYAVKIELKSKVYLMKHSLKSLEKLELSQDEIEKIATFFHIIHHSSGRIRLRVSKDFQRTVESIGEEKLLNLFESIKNLAIIKNIKINKIIGSVTIEYDKKMFEPKLWELWFNQKESTLIYEHLQQLIKAANE